MNVRLYLMFGLLICSVVSAELVRFDGGTPGAPPAGWTVAMTHAGGSPRWVITPDSGALSPPFVLAQTSQDRTAGRFPLAIWGAAAIRNGEVSVAFKTISGIIDQAAGIVWRYRDPDNYYIVRANALENNIVLYKVENGVRLSIVPKGLPSRSYGVKHEIPKRQWNALRITFRENLYNVFLNSEHIFDAEDGTFLKAGKTGLWTKADSVIYFDDFKVIAGDK